MIPSIPLLHHEINPYTIMTIFAVLSSGIYGCIVAYKKKEDFIDLIVFVLFCYIGVFIGGQLLYAIININDVIRVISNFGLIVSVAGVPYALSRIFGGIVFYGGLIGGIFTGFILVKRNRKYSVHVDIVAACIPLFHFFGRIGCFLGGCCYGIESSFGFTYRYSLIESANGVNRFPVQLLEALFNITLFFVLDRLRRLGMFKNRILLVYLVCYAVARFFLEFLRGDSYRGFFLGLSTSQIISILILCFVFGFILKTRYSGKKSFQNS